MSTNTYKSVRTRNKVAPVIPQSAPVSPNQVANNAGGFTFTVDMWKKLDRFLILGSEGGTFYVAEKALTKENAKNVEKCIKADGLRVVKTVVEISDAGRAYKNDPALFVLAMCSAADSADVRKAALEALPKVARIGTHLFHFAQYAEQFRGWGRALRNSVADWYNEKPLGVLANQAVKYQSRDGWSHRDLLRLAHPKTEDKARNEIYSWMVGKVEDVSDTESIIHGFNLAKAAKTDKEIIKLIKQYNLPREAVPTSFLNSAKVWEALLENMPLTAMIRNVGKMSTVGLLTQGSDAARHINSTLRDAEAIKKARIHPMGVLLAARTYGQGHGFKGSNSWTVVQSVVDALDDAFELSFGNVTPTGKRVVIGLDVSGSMGSPIMNSAISCAEASTAMSLITKRVEDDCEVMGFCDTFVDLGISKKDSLTAAMRKTTGKNFGGTDCALPMLWALGQNTSGSRWGSRGAYTKGNGKIVKADAFIVFTDNETWAGHIHPHKALEQYRQITGIDAKLIVVGMAANDFTIANPEDAGMLDVVGFDAAVPEVLSAFIRG